MSPLQPRAGRVPERTGDLVIRRIESDQRLGCTICGSAADGPGGLFLSVAGSGEAVCVECGRGICPPLASLLELGAAGWRASSGVADRPLLIPHHCLLALAISSARLRLTAGAG